MSEGRGASPGTARTVPGWIKLLVALHVFASIVWALPLPGPDIEGGKVQPHATLWLLYWNAKYLKRLGPIRSYILCTGAWQYWDMFAPEPAFKDRYGTADITYRDGTTRNFAYPRIHDLSIPMKYVKERYRKFYERADDAPANGILWPTFSQAIAFWAYKDPKNPPIVVRLKEHLIEIAAPGKPQAKEYDEHEYYAYAVDQEQLREAASGR